MTKRNPHPPHKHHPRGCLVKRRGHTERYDERKIYASCYAAALAAQVPHREAERIAAAAAKAVTAWVKKQQRCVSASEIFQAAARALRTHHEDVAFMYETHRDVS